MTALTDLLPAPAKHRPKKRAEAPNPKRPTVAERPASNHPTAPVVLPAAGSEVLAEPREWLWTPELYQQAFEAGFFDGMRVELVKGRVYVMPAMGNKHVTGIRLANYEFHRHFTAGFTVDCQLPQLYELSKPEPDLTVLRGEIRELDDDPKRVLLVLEVSDSTLRFDQRVKSVGYAEAGYPDYWIVNIPNSRIEVRREPRQAADGTWAYAQLTRHGPGAVISPLADPNVKIAVDDLLP